MTQRGLYAQRFSHGSFTQRSFYTEKHLNRASFIHRSIYTHNSFTYTQSFYTQTLLRIEACSQSLQTEGLTQRGLYTEQLLHTDTFTQRCTEQLLHTDAPRLLRKEVFTHKLYTDKLLHREASTQSIFLTQKHLHTKKNTHTDTKALHTELLHTDAFTHRSLFAEQGLHSSFYTPKLLHRERPLHRADYTILYTQKL